MLSEREEALGTCSLVAGFGLCHSREGVRGACEELERHQTCQEASCLPPWQRNHSWSSSAAPQGWHITPLKPPQEAGQQSVWVFPSNVMCTNVCVHLVES